MSQVLKDCKIWVGGFDVSGLSNRVSLPYEVDAIEDTNIGDTTHVAKGGGTKRFAFAYEGFWSAQDPASLVGSSISSVPGPIALIAHASFDGASSLTVVSDYTADLGFGAMNLGSGVGGTLPPWVVRAETRIDGLISPAQFFAAGNKVQRDVSEGDFVVDGHETGTIAVITDSALNDGTYTVVGVSAQQMSFDEDIQDETSTGFVKIVSGGRAQNARLTGGPDTNIGAKDIVNDNFEISFRAMTQQGSGTFGVCFRSNHITTDDNGRDYYRLYVDAVSGGTQGEVHIQKRINNASVFDETVGTVTWALNVHHVVSAWVSGSECTIEVDGVQLGSVVDLTQGVDTDDLNDPDHQKAGIITYEDAIVNRIDWVKIRAAVTDKHVFDAIGNTSLMGVGPTDGSAGEVGYFGQIAHAKYRIRGQIGDLLRVAHSAQGASALVRGTILANETVTGDGNGSAFQVGAATSSQKVYASLQIPDLRRGLVLVTIESDDNSDFTSANPQFTFTVVADGNVFEWETPLDGPITDDYWRAAWTVTGSTDVDVVVILGIQ